MTGGRKPAANASATAASAPTTAVGTLAGMAKKGGMGKKCAFKFRAG